MKCSRCVKTILIVIGAVAAVAGIVAAVWANWEKLMALKERCCKKNYIDVIEFPNQQVPQEPDEQPSEEPEQPEEYATAPPGDPSGRGVSYVESSAQGRRTERPARQVRASRAGAMLRPSVPEGVPDAIQTSDRPCASAVRRSPPGSAGDSGCRKRFRSRSGSVQRESYLLIGPQYGTRTDSWF